VGTQLIILALRGFEWVKIPNFTIDRSLFLSFLFKAGIIFPGQALLESNLPVRSRKGVADQSHSLFHHVCFEH
jgi:hypothetical protein